jgi:hypothetical protein
MFRQLVYSLETSIEVARTRIINVYARTYDRLMNRHRRRRMTAIFQDGGGDSYHCSYLRYIRRKIILSGSVSMSAVYRSKYVWSLAVCILFTDLPQQTDTDPDAPAVVIKLCYNMDVPFRPNFSERIVPMAKRFDALSSGVTASIQSTTSLAPSSTSTDPANLATTTNSMPTSAESGIMSATNSSSPQASSSSSFSLGAKIGVGFAIPLVVILLAIGSFWCFRRRHPKHRPSVMADEAHDEPEEVQMPVEAGGEPILEMDSTTESMPRPYSFEFQNQPSSPQLDSKTGFGSVVSGLSSPVTSPTTASFARRTLSPTSPSPFPPPWETDQSEVAYHLLQRPLGSPSLQSPETQSPQIQSPQIQSPKTQSPKTQSSKTQSPTTQSPATQSPTTQSPTIQSPTTQSPTTQSLKKQSPKTQSAKTRSAKIQSPKIPPPSAQITRPQNLPAMSVSRSDDAELLRLEAEIAQVREKKERLRYLSELEAREEELLRNIAERKRMAALASGGPT